uniref:PilZ domain-containing protein n=1 Tax=uncultured Erythrobacter sp. TaxID=263913 RepID=UPI0026067EE6|nr:PilZ domain-containing protein [uncultured Erythrobacter sp.]
MDIMATNPSVEAEVEGATNMRAAPRFTLLIRAARLVAHEGEFVCVIRDVSETGISVRMFHSLPKGDPLELHMPGGGTYEVRPVWERDNEAGFEFTKPVEVSQIINEASEYPKRGLRLGVFFPITVSTMTQSGEAIVENLSQQGARFESETRYAIDQTVKLSSPNGLKEVRAKVRWRRDNQYGVVFDDTFTLGDFARLAARLQAPTLLSN